MKDNKLETITILFERHEIRSISDADKEDYYFSVVDVIGAFTNAKIPRNYWSDLKRKSSKNGKMYYTDALNTEAIFRLIESVQRRKPILVFVNII